MLIRERKVRYDGSIAEYDCRIVKRKERSLVLLYEIPYEFHIDAGGRTVHIPPKTMTVGFYWEDRPYNVYHWRTKAGAYLGSYFNLVRDTSILERTVSYVDLIVDLMVLPDGSHAVLDLDELPEPLSVFENGRVEQHLQQLIDQKDGIVADLIDETNQLIERQWITEIAR